MTENINFKVSVRCMTYNQAAYIEDAMNGFCMQKTDFPFVCIVMDDASTDGEQEVIKKYLESHFDMDDRNHLKRKETDDYKLIFTRHKENKNCYFAVFFLKYNHYWNHELKNKKTTYYSELESKVDYIAFCEGDDYWINSYKLKLQVNYLQNNPDYGMCYTDFNILFQKTNVELTSVLKNRPLDFPSQYDSLDRWILSKKYLGPMTWFAKKDLFLNAPKLDSLDGTFVQFAHYYACSKVHCIKEETTAVYRIHNSSVTHGESYNQQYKRERGMFEIQIKLADIYKEKLSNYDLLKDKIRDDYYSKLFLIIYNNDRDELAKAMKWMKGKMTCKQKMVFVITRTKLGRYIVFSNLLSKIRRKPSDILE